MKKQFKQIRKQTLDLIRPLEIEDMVIQTDAFVSPIKWHLAHTTWFFENFVIIPNQRNYKVFDEKFSYIFNSYYHSLGSFNPSNKRGFLNRPTLREVLSYRKYVEDHVNNLIDKKKDSEFKFVIELGLNHEQQHQELILMDVLNIFFNNPLKPAYQKKKNTSKNGRKKNEWIMFDESIHQYGAKVNAFCFDNEIPIGETLIKPFKVTRDFVNNKDWKEFIDDNGYNRTELWLSDGWDYIKKNSINKPMYWLDLKHHFTLNGITDIEDYQPVSHISFYEADAYCRYKNMRLPSEFEIELVLEKNKIKGNFLENKIFEPVIPESNSNNFYGDLWMWTSSNYKAFEGYKPFSGFFSEYNGKFMCNQFVLKGGSCITPRSHLRPSYRNFYYPDNRWQFSGIRLASETE